MLLFFLLLENQLFTVFWSLLILRFLTFQVDQIRWQIQYVKNRFYKRFIDHSTDNIRKYAQKIDTFHNHFICETATGGKKLENKWTFVSNVNSCWNQNMHIMICLQLNCQVSNPFQGSQMACTCISAKLDPKVQGSILMCLPQVLYCLIKVAGQQRNSYSQ